MASSRRGRTFHKPPSHVEDAQVSAADAYLNTWITRYNDISFKSNGLYHGVVETIQSKGAATVVIGEKERGIPLLWNDNWCKKGVKFAKVLLLVDRLRPSIDQPEYDKDTIMREKIKEGEILFVVVEESKKSPEIIYKYFASSAFKIEAAGKILDESILLQIRDPLRGIVDSYVSQDVGIVRFGTYNGLIAKALFTSQCFKGSSRIVEGNLKNVAPVHTMVYVEVTKWHGKARAQEWEKLLLRDGIFFKATLVWPKDSARPVRKGGEEEKVAETRRCREYKERGFKGSVEDLLSQIDANAKGDQKTNYNLTDIHAYYGVIEIIPSSTVAVICTAHRRGEPLSWMDNWFAKGISMERILLISDHVRISKNASECAKGTPMKTLLQKGDRVMVVVEPTTRSPDKCYKWFAKTCWKVTDEERIPQIPLNLLPGHLRGEVCAIVSHDMGIISFETHHGYAAKAFFSHSSYYKEGRKILAHIPLGSEIKKGRRVYLIADKWHPGRSPKEVEQLIREEEINYRVVMAWEIGSSRPDESNIVGSQEGVKTDGKQKMPQLLDRNDPFELISPSATQKGQGKSSEFKLPGKERKQFAGNRGGKRGGRSHPGVVPSKNQQRNDDSKSCGDWVDLYDNLEELSEFLGAASVSTENLSTTSSSQSESKFPLKMSSRNKFSEEEHIPLKKNVDLMIGKTDNSLKYQLPLNATLNQSKNVKVSHIDGTNSGTLISIDESWGLLQVDGDDVHDFQSNAVYMYGLKLEDVPLHRLFHQGQTFKVHMEGGKITAVEYGAPQLPNLIRKAISVYCENNSIPEDVMYKLECIMKCYGV